MCKIQRKKLLEFSQQRNKNEDDRGDYLYIADPSGESG